VSERIGIAVYCTTCGHRKKPVGRAAPLSMHLCNAFECDGYYQEPHPGQLWPGERESEFGYPCGTHGTIVSDDYPAWICADCGSRLGRLPADHISTWHRGTCGWCGEDRDVTEPRDYGYPKRP
jgi:hypothetical protein